MRQLYFGWGSWSVNGRGAPDLPSWAMKLIDPGWCGAMGVDITVGQMQDRYVELFGPVENALPNAPEGLKLEAKL